LNQLIYHLRQLGYGEAAKAIDSNASQIRDLPSQNLIRQEIDRLILQGILDRDQALKISTEITKEAFESLLWLKNGSYHWQEEPLNPDSTQVRLDVAKLIEYYQQRLTVWQKYITIIHSPHQRPYLTNHQLLEKPIPQGTLSPKALTQITQLMRGVSLRELALFLKQDELKVLKLLVPYIRENIICLREPAVPFNLLPNIPEPPLTQMADTGVLISSDQEASSQLNQTKTYKIACIDDSPVMLDQMERFLQKKGSYILKKIEDPIRASSVIFRFKPDLILMDITMPEINGYKLCYLFRNSDTFAQTPIIMVTGNKGLIDKARAKIVGATDYLTKPFSEEELLALVEKYLT
jgi:twitching motility two-component system response regulator PilG